MTRRIPLFPLPGVVLMPGTLLPLHIFEPRYRKMVTDVLSGDRTIGMAMLKGGVESDAGGSPIYAVGGAGEIIESEELEDGRYNILLEERFRYRIVEETSSAPYRVATVEPIAAAPFSSAVEESRVAELASKVFTVVRTEIELPPLPEGDLPAERLASEIALRLRYRPEELQALLETDSLSSRFAALISRMMEWQKRVEFLADFRPADPDASRN